MDEQANAWKPLGDFEELELLGLTRKLTPEVHANPSLWDRRYSWIINPTFASIASTVS